MTAKFFETHRHEIEPDAVCAIWGPLEHEAELRSLYLGPPLGLVVTQIEIGASLMLTREHKAAFLNRLEFGWLVRRGERVIVRFRRVDLPGKLPPLFAGIIVERKISL